jgi:polyhydroxyalkanoate synthase
MAGLGANVAGADYSALAFKGGHIGIYVSGRSQKEIAPAFAEWLTARS